MIAIVFLVVLGTSIWAGLTRSVPDPWVSYHVRSRYESVRVVSRVLVVVDHHLPVVHE
jgi:hypothetical protein